MIKKILTYLIITLPFTNLIAQQITEQNIAFYIKYLENIQYNDTLNLENIFLITKKQELRKKYILQLKYQQKKIQNKLINIQNHINDLENKLSQVKSKYAKMLILTYLYKKFYPSNLIFILSAKTFNHTYLRIKFLQLSTKYLKSLTKIISTTKKELEYQKQIYKQSLKIRQQLIKKISLQQSALQEEYALMAQIQKNSRQYHALLEELKSFYIVQNALNKEIVTKIDIKDIKSEEISKQFEQNKGFLPSPLNNAIIVIPFGIHQHPKLKAVKITNDGIDLTSITDTIVKAVFQGTVKSIITLPNKQKAILLSHGNYYTVYSNLGKVLVAPGQKVKTGQEIGIIKGANSNKNQAIFNFQIWHNTKKLNPENWINL